MIRKVFLLGMIVLLGASGVAAREPAVRLQPAPADAPVAALPTPLTGDCFVAGINGGSEVPSNASPATGIGAFVLAPPDPLTTTRKLSYHIAFTNTLAAENNAHIHRGAPGVSGPVVRPLPLGPIKTGVLTLTQDLVTDLISGTLYVNIHTVGQFSAGEIRGQILPGGSCFTAAINGASETPPNASPGIGTGTFLLVPPDPVTTTRRLVYTIAYTGTVGTETVSHLHKAPPGVPGPPVVDLPLGNPKTGVLTLTGQLANDLLSGLLYVNIHTNIVVAGEIRGQIVPLGSSFGSCFSATLTGANEAPQPNNSANRGRGFFTLARTIPVTATATTTVTLSYYITFTNTLSETNAHIHKAAPGVAGGVIFPLPLGNPKSGSVVLNPQQVADLLSGLYYVNIHSSQFQQGEIRGQIVGSRCAARGLALIAR